MIRIENGDFKFEGNGVDLVCDLGMVWFMIESNPDWWREVRNVVLPSLIETIDMTEEQVEFLSDLKVLCDKHPRMFDKGGRNGGDVRVGKLKFEGGEK